jgi:hypothetical protein
MRSAFHPRLSPGALALLVTALISSGSSGCATIFSAGPDQVPINTNPQGATVFVDNVPVGQTPLLVSLDRTRNTGVLRIELPGFAPVIITRSKSINGWFWANLCVGIVGIVIDLATGNVQGFDDAPIAIGLTPAYAPDSGPGGPPGYPPAPGGYPPPPPPYPPAGPPPSYPPPR